MLTRTLLDLVATLREFEAQHLFEELDGSEVDDRFTEVWQRAVDVAELLPDEWGTETLLTPEACEEKEIGPVRRVLDRGGRFRAVYARPLHLQTPLVQRVLRAEVPLGAEHRTSAIITRVAVIDRRYAFLSPTTEDWWQGVGLFSQDPRMVQLAEAIFEESWRGARGLHEDPHVVHRQREILLMLSDGHTDETIARRLGVSGRTVARVVADLQRQLGATSRFQLGLRAARAGLVD